MFVGRANFPYTFHSRRRRRHRRHGKPEFRRNIPSAFFGLIVTGLYAVTMAEPNWFQLEGGECTGKHLGLYTIFGMDVEHMKDSCINNDILTKLRVCAALALLGVISSMFQFTLDVCGTSKRGLKLIRKNSFGHILSDIAFYLVIGSGVAAVIATTLSLLQITCEKRQPRPRYGSDMQLQLICHNEAETFDNLPPVAPPAYQE
ncbi:transmembrane protein 127-like isoform X2 [Hydractinia symbiolongicarpus]|uniref:transmembrane protein 127-like isoform X2 n=1 Tax=Hydractinia symbiolongicarpus TaxID=13093 RepID=UPI00255148F8|nr:transmembrane protein 127-like isoform X2 [Hydractinia symbiolongicarpus]